MSFIDLVNANSNIKFKLKSAIFNKKEISLDIQLLYPDDTILSNEERLRIEDIAKREFAEVKKINIKYIKQYFDEEILKRELSSYVCKNFSSALISKFVFESEKNAVFLTFDEIYRDFFDVEKVVSECSGFLEKRYDSIFEIYIDFIKDEDSSIQQPEFIEKSIIKNTYSIGTKEAYIGDVIDSDPIQISSIREAGEGIVIAGKISHVYQSETKPKKDASGKIRPTKKYFKFTLRDFSGEIELITFPSQTNMSKFEKLVVDSDVVVFGDVQEDSFSNGLIMRPRAINLCILPKDFLDIVIRKSLPKTYRFVTPEPIISGTQVNLFDSAKDDDVVEFLKENTIVVFDFETTGLDASIDRIIEIGAVKIENGKMTETFACMVNPEMHIPEESSKINNIFDKDVQSAHTIDKLIPDFYKFCFGSVLVAYNIDFDYKFLAIAGRKNGYVFDNQKLDALLLARTALRGELRNFKLVKVADHLGVSLENAHRAVNDAIATAEVFIKLSEHIEKIR